MTEQQLIKQQLIKNMLLNLITFTLIFSILGIILYSKVESSIYKSSDQELTNKRNIIGILSKMENASKEGNDNNNEIKLNIESGKSNSNKPTNMKQNENLIINPRIVYLIRNSDGTIKMQGQLADTFNTIKFDSNYLDKIYKIQIEEMYNYRAINYEIQNNNETIYVQALINVDAEESILKNFSKTLIISISASIAISIIASYILSKKTLKPIIESWKKQTEFVQNASHELRTPLTIIQAKQELLLEEPQSKIIEKSEDITITLNETRRLSKLVKDLMELARSDSAKCKLNKTKVKVDDLIEKVVEPFKDMTEIQGKKLELKLNYNREIEIDQNKIHEVLVIVLDNSMKYTEKGDSIIISTEEKDGKLVLDIADTGIGISDEAINHVFERFYREDKARSRQTGGSGLGLSIANSIVVEEHGGTITAKHNKPKGTIIEIKLK